ncbi:hypothetical protein GCM10027517_22700 [Phycicoccus ginsengisoli]
MVVTRPVPAALQGGTGTLGVAALRGFDRLRHRGPVGHCHHILVVERPLRGATLALRRRHQVQAGTASHAPRTAGFRQLGGGFRRLGAGSAGWDGESPPPERRVPAAGAVSLT